MGRREVRVGMWEKWGEIERVDRKWGIEVWVVRRIVDGMEKVVDSDLIIGVGKWRGDMMLCEIRRRVIG